MRRDRDGDGERAQAFTLEGLIAATIVLLALLFALQSAVITPTTGGAVDRTDRAHLETELRDSLVVAAHADEGNLSELVRYYDDGFANASTLEGETGERFVLGEILAATTSDRGLNYNLRFVYHDGGDRTETPVVSRGTPDPNAVTASYAVTLYDNQTVRPDGSAELWEAEEYPIPNERPDETVYNVVEVRVIVW